MGSLNNPTGAGFKSGTYSGDGSQNRAIPHGMGLTPRLVMVFDQAGITASSGHSWITGTSTSGIATGGTSNSTTTAVDSTNFYAGVNAAGNQSNLAGKTYVWYAFT